MMPFRILLVSFCLTAFTAVLIAGVSTAPAAQNPFISSKKEKAPPPKNPIAGYPAFLQPLMKKVAVLQYTLKRSMVRLAKDIRQHPLGRSFWGFMLLSFAYGVVHALGPGHGKLYTCSYFISRPGTLKRVLLFGNLTMLMHVLSGTILILFGALVLKTSGAMTLENSGIILERISYGILTAVGIFIAGKIIREMRSGHGHSHDCPDQADTKSLVVTALAVGIVPCPGAALILLFSLTLGILTTGLWAMLCIAAGMAITASMFALGAIGFRKAFLSLAQGNNRRLTGVYVLLSLGGAMCISLLGLLLLLGSF
jgi:ABC-type nickel/cobalt efflux system permease component RcnA